MQKTQWQNGTHPRPTSSHWNANPISFRAPFSSLFHLNQGAIVSFMTADKHSPHTPATFPQVWIRWVLTFRYSCTSRYLVRQTWDPGCLQQSQDELDPTVAVIGRDTNYRRLARNGRSAALRLRNFFYFWLNDSQEFKTYRPCKLSLERTAHKFDRCGRPDNNDGKLLKKWAILILF